MTDPICCRRSEDDEAAGSPLRATAQRGPSRRRARQEGAAVDEPSRPSIHVGIAALIREICERSPQDVAIVLQEVTAAAADHVPGAQHASITAVDRHGHIDTPTVTGPGAQLLDDIQKRHQQGPCLQAALEGRTVLVDDLNTDARWPIYQRHALTHTPIRSVLSVPMAASRETMGTLNFYAEQTHAFNSESLELGFVWATHVGQAWTAVRLDIQFRAALASRDIIGQAKGMLMERYSIDASAAFNLLRKLSQQSNMRIREIAREIVGAEQLDHHDGSDVVEGWHSPRCEHGD